MLKMSEVKKLDDSAITQKIGELRKELFELRLQKNTTSVEKPHLLTTLKRDIARLLTVLNSKEASK
jgi:large subunit ribosomal protein L29